METTTLPIQNIPLANVNTTVRCMFDNCSQTTFIQNRTAQKLNIKGTPISFVLICTDGSEKPSNGYLYKLNLKDKNGYTHQIEAIGLHKLSTEYPAAKVFGVKKALNHLTHISSSLTDEKLSRDGGELDILMGTDLANLHPKTVANINHLVILQSLFGTGWTIMGHNEDHVQFIGEEKGCRVARL